MARAHQLGRHPGEARVTVHRAVDEDDEGGGYAGVTRQVVHVQAVRPVDPHSGSGLVRRRIDGRPERRAGTFVALLVEVVDALPSPGLVDVGDHLPRVGAGCELDLAATKRATGIVARVHRAHDSPRSRGGGLGCHGPTLDLSVVEGAPNAFFLPWPGTARRSSVPFTSPRSTIEIVPVNGMRDGSAGAYGPNAWLVEEMYEAFLADPTSVSESWREFFADYRSPSRTSMIGGAQAAADAAPVADTDSGGRRPTCGADAAPSSSRLRWRIDRRGASGPGSRREGGPVVTGRSCRRRPA